MIDWKHTWPGTTSRPYRHSWPDVSEALPVDVMPCSNEEYFPPPPTKEQIAIMHLAERETERWRRKLGMSRRHFVRSAAAMSIGFWAIDAVQGGRFGTYGSAHNTATTDACDLEWAGRHGLETLSNLPGEFVFDVQSHHVDPDGMWRITNPSFHAFFAAVWPQSSWATGDQPGVREDGGFKGGGAGEVDPIQNLSRYHYLKELFLDSATSATVLSCVPTSPDTENPLPLAEAALTVHTVNDLAKSRRSVMHAFVMPNRGSAGNASQAVKPLYLDDELNLMMERARQYGDILRGWKTYCAWGDVPNASGWTFDTDTGMAFVEQVRAVSAKHPQIPPVVATHKGFALPGFDQRAAAPRDIGIVARQYPDVRFIVYHSGYDIGDRQRPYRGDADARSDTNTVDGLIKSLRENKWDATWFRRKGQRFANVPNVWAELGSVWRSVMHDPDECAHLLGKLITYVGPKRIAWGTDSLWYGSPHAEIVALRKFEFTEEGKKLYRLPYGLEGDVGDPRKKAKRPERTIRNAILGRNAARAYNFDPDARRNEISCDEVNGLRTDAYVTDAGTAREAAPLRSNESPGPRTRREIVQMLKETPWSP